MSRFVSPFTVEFNRVPASIHYFFNFFEKSDKMRPYDLLLAGASEIFSPKSDHGMEVN